MNIQPEPLKQQENLLQNESVQNRSHTDTLKLEAKKTLQSIISKLKTFKFSHTQEAKSDKVKAKETPILQGLHRTQSVCKKILTGLDKKLSQAGKPSQAKSETEVKFEQVQKQAKSIKPEIKARAKILSKTLNHQIELARREINADTGNDKTKSIKENNNFKKASYSLENIKITICEDLHKSENPQQIKEKFLYYQNLCVALIEEGNLDAADAVNQAIQDTSVQWLFYPSTERNREEQGKILKKKLGNQNAILKNNLAHILSNKKLDFEKSHPEYSPSLYALNVAMAGKEKVSDPTKETEASKTILKWLSVENDENQISVDAQTADTQDPLLHSILDPVMDEEVLKSRHTALIMKAKKA